MKLNDETYLSITDALESLDMINYHEFMKFELVQDYIIGHEDGVKVSNTLEMFSFYKGNMYKYSGSVSDQIMEMTVLMKVKLVQLSIISMIRELKVRKISYDYLKKEFDVVSDWDLEKLLIKICNGNVLRLRLDSPEREVEVIDLKMRNIVNDVSELKFLQKDQVVMRSELVDKLTKFQDKSIKLANGKLRWDSDIVQEDVINKLIKLDLIEINKIVKLRDETNNDELNSRKRKVNDD